MTLDCLVMCSAFTSGNPFFFIRLDGMPIVKVAPLGRPLFRIFPGSVTIDSKFSERFNLYYV